MNDEQQDQIQSLFDHLDRVQRNLQPEDIIRNDASVDAFLWKGARNPTKVQRVGFVVMGGFLSLCGVVVAASIGTKDFIVVPTAIGLAFCATGIKVASNAIRRRSH